MYMTINSSGHDQHSGSVDHLLSAFELLRNGGNLGQLAEDIGIHRNSISRLFKGAGFDKKRLLEAAKKDEAK